MNRKLLLPLTIIFLLLLLVVALPGPAAFAQLPGTGWGKYSANPVVDIGNDAEWDDGLVGASCVIEDSGSYKMWYSGYDGANFLEIGYATSPDGITWTKYTSNPVLNVGTGWEASGVGAPSVIKESDTSYKMWYTGIDASNILRIGYAESTNGTVWTNRQMVLEPQEAWEETGVGAPCVIEVPAGGYKMFYTGRTGDNLGTQAIGYATSTNGTAWLQTSTPIFEGGEYTWEDRGAGFACVIPAPGGTPGFMEFLDMWYTGYAGTGEEEVSSAIGFAHSEDGGMTWTKVTTPALSGEESWEVRGVAAPWITSDGKYMAYTGIDANLNTTIGFALRLIAETQLSQLEGASKTVLMPLSIVDVRDPFTLATLQKSITWYFATSIYDPAGIEMLPPGTGINWAGDAPFTNPIVDVDNVNGLTTITEERIAGAPTPIIVSRLVPRLIGDATTAYDVVVILESILDTDDEVIKEQQTATLTFQRGDVQPLAGQQVGDGFVKIGDALRGAQYVVGLRPAGDVLLLNLASVHHDDPVDKANIADCLYIAQKVVGMRDNLYE